jgi:hypothetical protein
VSGGRARACGRDTAGVVLLSGVGRCHRWLCVRREHQARLAAIEAEAKRKREEIEAARPKTPPLFIFSPGGEEGTATGMAGGGKWLAEMAMRFARSNESKRLDLMLQVWQVSMVSMVSMCGR